MTWRLLVCWSVKQKETKGNRKEIKLRKKKGEAKWYRKVKRRFKEKQGEVFLKQRNY